MKCLILLPLLLAQSFAFGAAPAESVALSKEEVVPRIAQGISQLKERYWSPTLGIWLDEPGDDLRGAYDGTRRPPWWPSANAVEVLLDFMKATGRSDYLANLENLYVLQKDHRGRTDRVIAELKRRNQWSDRDERALQRRLRREEEARAARGAAGKPPAGGYYTDFQNEYLDDSGWWAVTWLKMYDRTYEQKYLTTAKTIHAHMAANWRPEKGGGVLWCEDEDKQKPNAITNNLFLILSARLANRTGDAQYLQWAEKTLNWIREVKLFDGTAIVDAPGHEGDYWSYNQGTFIGGLVAMHQATGDEKYLKEAVEFANGVLERAGLTQPDGSVFEKLGTEGDAAVFKGIFVRYLAQLRDYLAGAGGDPAAVKKLDQCIQATATSLLRNGVAADGFFKAEWHEGAMNTKTDFGTQVSGLAALVAVLPQHSP